MQDMNTSRLPMFACVLLTLLVALSVSAPSTSIREDSSTQDSFEYIVVGSGPGGGPLAANLARKGHRVLLIEAGEDEGKDINYQVPAFQGKSTEDPKIRWDYFVNHYKDPATARKDPKMTWKTSNGQIYTGKSPPAGSIMNGILYPRAGTLGGCGSHNALITVYPFDSDWDYIAALTKDDSWSASKMRGYFERLEDCQYLPNSAVGHGFNGWLADNQVPVTLATKDTKVLSWLFAAADTAGEGSLIGKITGPLTGLINLLTRDVNAEAPGRDSEQGLYQIPLTIRHGARNGPRDFVHETVNAKNSDGSKMYPLDVKLNTLVTKVLFDTSTTKSGKKPKATGVSYISGKSLYAADPRHTGAKGTAGKATATREVILSAGAFNTPQLLKLSGIGPPDELRRFKIPVLVNSPAVGTNLQDRYESGVVSKTDTPFSLTKDCTFNMGGGSDPCLQQWETSNNNIGKGTYVSNGFAAAVLKHSSTAPSTNTDLYIFGGPVKFHGYYPGYADDAVKDAKHWTWAILKAQTSNRAGTVQLTSDNPMDPPTINFNYFDTGTTAGGVDKDDLQAVAEGVAFARKIATNLPPGSANFTEVLPGHEVKSQKDIEEYVHNTAWGHHASCTCPIGAVGDKNAVLDSKFRVQGTEGLRVVDASVFPKIPGIFIAVPVYQISEKAADVISADAE